MKKKGTETWICLEESRESEDNDGKSRPRYSLIHFTAGDSTRDCSQTAHCTSQYMIFITMWSVVSALDPPSHQMQ